MDATRCITNKETLGELSDAASAAGEPQALTCCQIRAHPDLEIYNNVIVLGCEKSFKQYEVQPFEPVYDLDHLKDLTGTNNNNCSSDGPERLETSEDIVIRANIHAHDLQDQICARSFECSRMTGAGPRFTKEIGLSLLYKTSDGTLELTLQGNKLYQYVARINDEDLPSVNAILETTPDISRVNLSYNNVGDTGLQQLGAVIQELPSLLHVDLSFNDFTAKGLFAFITYLLHRKPLQSLRLTGNMFGDEGFKALACLVLSGRCPEELDVTECDMSPLGFRALCCSLHAIDTGKHVVDCFIRDIQLPLELTYLKEARDLLADELKRSTHKDAEPVMNTTLEAIKDSQYNVDWTSGCPRQIFRAFSQTVLGGLIELSQRLKLESKALMDIPMDSCTPDVVQVPSDFHCSVVDQICNYRKEKQFDNLSERKRISEDCVIVSRSLYSLELAGSPSFDEEEDFGQEGNQDQDLSKNPHYGSCLKSAENLVTQVFADLSENQNLNAVLEVRVDVAQTLLMNIAESLEKQRNKKCTSCFDEPALKNILAESFQKTKMSLMSDCGFGESASLCISTVQSFLESIFESCETALKMAAADPVFLKALTLQCQHTNSEHSITYDAQTSTTDPIIKVANEVDCFNIAASFLHGVCIGAAKSIANTGRNKVQITAEAETSARVFVQETFHKAASLAAEVKTKNDLLTIARTDLQKMADDLVVDIFSEVADEVVSRRNMIVNPNETTSDSLSLTSKPICLVLSRPLFHQTSSTMAETLGEFLKTNNSISSLYISKWELRDEGTERLMIHMQYNLNIMVLDLSCNGLRSGSMKCIAKYLAANTNLQMLNLSCNPIGDYGMAYLNAVIVESSIKSMNIRNCDVTYRQLDRFLDRVSRTKITTLYLWGNKYGETTVDLLDCLLNSEILAPDSTDISVQRVEGQKFVVNNSPADFRYARNTCSSFVRNQDRQ